MEIECEQRITRLEESAKSAHHRIDDLSEVAKEIRTLALGLNTMNTVVTQVKESQDTLIKKVEEIEMKPAKRWETIVWEIGKGIALLLIGAAITKLFMGG